jgi:transposase-like protein
VENNPTKPSLDPQLVNQLLASRQTPGEIEDLLKDLRKAIIESALDGELTHLPGYQKHPASGRGSGNSRNGKSRKMLKTAGAQIEIQIPRNREGEFEPQMIPKHQRRREGFDEAILALDSRGMTTRDIQSFLEEKYDDSL